VNSTTRGAISTQLTRAAAEREPNRRGVATGALLNVSNYPAETKVPLVMKLASAPVFVAFLELSFFFEKQLLECSAPRWIGCLFEHCPVMLNVLPNDETLHERPSTVMPTWLVELDQSRFVQLKTSF